jgi:RNA polymerase subunit RPABC4/transcription elongation factor Spt4
VKKIFSSPIVGEIPRLQNMLEGAGITCILRNEISSGLSPEIPITESTPELWIEDDHRLVEALQIKADFQASLTAIGENWQCQKCGEISEAQFTSCWKCGTIRETKVPVKWIQREQTAPASDEKVILEEVEGGTPCVACEKLIAVGKKFCPFCGWTQP